MINHASAYDAVALSPETPALLDRQIDDLLLEVRGLAVVRDLLSKKGASTDEVAAHTRALEAARTKLADLISGAGVPQEV